MAGSFVINTPIDTRLPLIPEGVDDNPQLFNEISKIYNAIRQMQAAITTYAGVTAQDVSIQNQVTPNATVLEQNMNRLYIKASVTLPFGIMVNLFNDGTGAITGRLADNASGLLRTTFAFCNTIGGIAAGSYGEVICGNGLCTGVTGLTIGTVYYLGINGLLTAAKPVAPALVQPVGYGLGTSLLYFKPVLIS